MTSREQQMVYTKTMCLSNLLWSIQPRVNNKSCVSWQFTLIKQPRVNNKSYVSLQFTWINTTPSQQQKLCVLAIYLDQNDPRSTTKAICLGNKLYLIKTTSSQQQKRNKLKRDYLVLPSTSKISHCITK